MTSRARASPAGVKAPPLSAVTKPIPAIVLISATLFSAYHYLGAEPFQAGTFAFRLALGVYLAGIYVYRGFGIAVGAHTVYDLIVVAFTHMR